MKDQQKTAKLFSILRTPNALLILSDLLDGRKTFAFFGNKYGKNVIVHVLSLLITSDMIKKIYNVTKTPIGYELTAHGRWVIHGCIDFQTHLIKNN